MSAKLRSSLRAFVLVCIILLSASRSYGSHIFGVDLYYTHVTGNTYTVHLVIYGDCAGSAFPTLPDATPEIDIYNGNAYVGDVVLAIQAPINGVEVTPVCPADAGSTTCSVLSSTIPGIKKFVYTGNVTVSGASAVWRFLFTGNMGALSASAGRSNSITNIIIPPASGSLIQLVDTLNNTTYNNSNAVYNTIPTPFFCINVPANFNPAAVDPDGDSLVFHLVPGIDGNTGTSVSYISPYTANAPLATATGTFSFNGSTGQLSFTPNLTQKSLVVYNVEEYHAGVLRGTSQREMSVVVLSPCDNNPPTGSITSPTGGTVVDSTQFSICNNSGTFSFHLDPTDADVTDSITMTVSGLPTGATFNITGNGTPTPLGTFAWSTVGVTPGNYTFYVTYKDNGCPLSSTQTLAYTITIYPSPTMSYALVSPATCLKKAVFTITPGGTLSPYTIKATEGSTTVQILTGITGLLTDSLVGGTYTIYTYNPDNCFVDTTITINSPALPGATIATAPPLCPGGATGTATVTGTAGVAPYQYAIGTGAYSASGIFTGLAAGTYTVYVKDANSCVKDTTITIPGAAPILMTTTIQKPLCNNFANGIVTISAYNSVPPYTYALGTGAYGSSGTFAALAAGTYTFEVMNANGCVVPTTVTLTDSENISAGLSIINVPCYGGNATVTVNATGSFGPPYTYAYSGGGTGATDVFNLPAGTYTVQVTDPEACFFDTSITIAQPAQGVISPTLENVSCYGGSSGAILIIFTGGTPVYQYAVNGSAWSTSNEFTGLSAGSQDIEVADANGCIYMDTVTLTQPAQLVINAITSQMPSCYDGANGTFIITASGGTTPYVYTYNTASYTASDELTGLTAGVYTLSVKDNNSCITDTVVSLSQPPAIAPAAIVVSPACNMIANGQVTLSASGGTPGYTYAMGTGAYSSSAVFGSLAAGSYTFDIKDANGCVKDTSITLTDSLHVSGTFTITPALCYEQASGTITVSGTGGSSPYSYAMGTGGYSTTNVYTGLAAGTYSVHITDNNGCLDDTTVTVTQPTNIVPSLSITEPACYGNSNGVVTIGGSGGTPGYTYSFDNGAYITAITYTGLPAGADSFTIKDANGCLHDTTFTMQQPAQLVVSTLTWTNISCNNGADGTITVTGAGGTSPYEYAAVTGTFSSGSVLTGFAAGTQTVYVKDANGCETDTAVTLTQPAPLVFTGADTLNPTCQGYRDGSVTLLVAGGTSSYLYSADNATFTANNIFDSLAEDTYTFYIKDANGCSNDTSITLTGLPHIVVDNISITAPTCYGAINGSIALTADGGVQPLYYMIDTNTAHEPTGIFDSLTFGTYVIIVTDSRNCFKDTSVTVPQPPSLTIETTITPNECIGLETGGGIIATVVGGTAPFTYLWSTDPQQTTAGINGLANGSYTVWVKDVNDCSDSTTVQVTYDDCCTPFIPSAFTPNNDGKDDIFRIRFKGDMSIVTFSVYNRFGQVVYSVSNTGNADQGWDGKFNGVPADVGTYFYYAKIICGNKGDHKVELKGDVTLIR